MTERITNMTEEEIKSLREWLASWGDGANWLDETGLTVPCAKSTLARLLDAADSAPSAPAEASTETGWLIEHHYDIPESGVRYWAGLEVYGDESVWTPDPSAAIRFARREDAEKIVPALHWEKIVVAEHVWGIL